MSNSFSVLLTSLLLPLLSPLLTYNTSTVTNMQIVIENKKKRKDLDTATQTWPKVAITRNFVFKKKANKWYGRACYWFSITIFFLLFLVLFGAYTFSLHRNSCDMHVLGPAKCLNIGLAYNGIPHIHMHTKNASILLPNQKKSAQIFT